MKDSQDIQSTTELQTSAQGTNEVQSSQPNAMATDAPAGDSGSLSSNDNRKVSREDIELVQNLIERCLQLYMNKGEVVRTLSTRARIEPGFTTLGDVANSVADDIRVWRLFLYLLVYFDVCFFRIVQVESVSYGTIASSIKLTSYSESWTIPTHQIVEQISSMNRNCSGQMEIFKRSLKATSVIICFLNLKHLDVSIGVLKSCCSFSLMLYVCSVWQKLEEENSEFFRAYYIRLKLKRQIILFNHLLQHQYNLMKYPAPPNVSLPPIQNGIHPMSVNNLPMGYPVLQQPLMPAPGQPHIDSMVCGLSSGHVANGIPAPGGYHPIRMNSGNDMVMDNGAPEAAHAGASAMSSEMAVSPSSAASSNHAPFTPSEIPGMAMDTSVLDSAFGSDVGNTGPLQLGPDGASRDSIRSLGQLWNFSLSDLTADLTSLGDLEALENYAGTPFLPSDSDLLLDSPDHDDIVEYFADTINGPSQSDEEKS